MARRRNRKRRPRRAFRFKMKHEKLRLFAVAIAFICACFIIAQYVKHRNKVPHRPSRVARQTEGAAYAAPAGKASQPSFLQQIRMPRLGPQASRPVPAPQLSFRERMERIKSQYLGGTTAVRDEPRALVSGNPKIAIVIDDMGHTEQHLPEIRALGRDVTYAILPFLKHTAFFDQLSTQTGADVILHLPLESVGGTIPGPGLITTAMDDNAVLDILRRDLSTVPHARGANNHMGSKGTSDRRLMNLILRELHARKLYFLDSMTTGQTATRAIAGEIGATALRRDIFLDNVDDPVSIRRKLHELAGVASAQGYAVGIGHYRENTLRVLMEEIPKLKSEGFELVRLRDLHRLKEGRA